MDDLVVLTNTQIDSKAIVSDACASYSTLDRLNHDIKSSLEAITQRTDFFAYYRLNLFHQVCPFWNDANSMCGNIACAVNTLDNEEDIPLIWRAQELSKLEGPKAAHPGRKLQQERGVQRPLQGTLGEDVGESCVVEYDDECDDRDYCVPEDESASAKGDYVSLVDNPERFTGYAGEGAHMVWDNIYRENCFPSEDSDALLLGAPQTLGKYQAANDLRSVIQARSPLSSSPPVDDTCLEKRVFHRLISGMHASISTHICHDYLNQTTGTWGPNFDCYQFRLAAHPERISNLYFNYALLLRAVTKLRTYLKSYTFCSGDPAQDASTKQKMLALISTASTSPPIFDESAMFADDASGGLREDFRNRFRNVSRMMDCVGCDKCRLWGKLQTVGYGTALKVLFEYDETKNGENPVLRRTELVALVNTLARVSHSLAALGSFRDMETTLTQDTPAVPVPPQTLDPHHPAALTEIPDMDDEDDDGDSDIPWDTPPDETVLASIRIELTLVYRTFLLVLKSWIELPGKIFAIFITEADRLWSFWLGLPIRKREWEFRRPEPIRREEL